MYFDEEYANGKISELAGMKIDTVKLYSEQIKNPEITITQMSFEDGDERLDFGPSVLYSNRPLPTTPQTVTMMGMMISTVTANLIGQVR